MQRQAVLQISKNRTVGSLGAQFSVLSNVYRRACFLRLKLWLRGTVSFVSSNKLILTITVQFQISDHEKYLAQYKNVDSSSTESSAACTYGRVPST
jgi:hypothetical protein